MSEVGLDAAIGRKRLIFEAFIVNELRLVNQELRERQRVGTSWSVLRNDDGAGAVVKSNDVLIFGWLDDGLAKRFGRSPSNHIMQAIDEAPPLPSRQQARNGVCQSVLVGRYDNAARAAFHPLHIAQDERRSDAVGLSSATASDNHGGIGTD